MNIFVSKYKVASLGHIADGGSVAEEVIGTIRTTQAFGSQNVLSAMYNSHISKSAQLEQKMAIVNGLGLSVFFFVIYSR
jgi:ATP-binding cassette subfamily B (MDR/TAP) protein 1